MANGFLNYFKGLFHNNLKNNLYNNHTKCIDYPKFANFGWETLYKKYMTNVIRILDTYSNISRLYLLIALDLTSNNLTNAISKLSPDTLRQSPAAVKLTSYLKEMLPDADPIYLDLVGEVYAFDEDGINSFIQNITTKSRSYPKMEQYYSKIKILNIIKSLTINFNVGEFLSICPNPDNYFKNIKINSNTSHLNESLSFLKHSFSHIPINHLRNQLEIRKFNLSDTVEFLKNNPFALNLTFIKRKENVPYYYRNHIKEMENIEFLKEVAYIENIDEIQKHIQVQNTTRNILVQEARSIGDLKTCQSCYNDEMLSTEVHSCPVGHYFCSSCIKQGVEDAVGENKMDFICYENCTEEFSLVMIKEIIDSKLYQYILRQKQVREIKAANIEGLESCAFCDYLVILSPDIKVINCLNPECKKETCRECRRESHLPNKCDETEYAPEIQIRTFIENKMTEVLIRRCFNCNLKFMKEDGCNWILCSCTKKMCYICQKPVDNLSHFYSENEVINEDETRCPIFTDNNILHVATVEALARIISNELMKKNPELLKKINIDKILPLTQHTTNSRPLSSVINNVISKAINQNFEDIINNLRDMRFLG